MCRRTRSSYCVAATSRSSSNRHRGDTDRLGVRCKELFSDRGWCGNAWLGIVLGGIRGMRRACSCRCVGSNGCGGVGGGD